jgi:hypothetical protein
MIDGYVNKGEKDPFMWFGLLCHLTWNYFLFRMLDTPWLACFVACNIQGILAQQLICNHYWKPFYDVNDQKKVNFPTHMVNTNTNIRCNPYMDWHYGGL